MAKESVVVQTTDDLGRRGPSREVETKNLGTLAGAKVVSLTPAGNALTLSDDHHGLVLDLYGTAGITVTVPNTLRSDFFCGLSQATANQITVSPGAGATVVSLNNQLKSGGQYALMTLMAFAEDTFRLFGSTSP